MADRLLAQATGQSISSLATSKKVGYHKPCKLQWIELQRHMYRTLETCAPNENQSIYSENDGRSQCLVILLFMMINEHNLPSLL